MSPTRYLLALSLVSTFACGSGIGDGNGDYQPDAGAETLDELGPDADMTPPPPPKACDEAVAISFEQRKATPDILLGGDPQTEAREGGPERRVL